jgi:hypothetical protein
VGRKSILRAGRLGIEERAERGGKMEEEEEEEERRRRRSLVWLLVLDPFRPYREP